MGLISAQSSLDYNKRIETAYTLETKMSALPKEQLDLEGAKNYIDDTFGKSDDFIVEPAIVEAANDQAPLTLFGRFVAYMDAWTQSSYDAWEKAGKPRRY
jgi:hypothetical protein